MKMEQRFSAKCVLILFGIVLRVECQGRYIIPKTRAQVADIERAICIFAMDHNGKLPASLDELTQLVKDGDNQPLLTTEDLIDPWGEPFGYESGGKRFVLVSSGPDREMGTKDDIFSGNSDAYEKKWKDKYTQAIKEQETNMVQEVTIGTTQPPDGTAKVEPNHVPTATAQPPAQPDNPAGEKATPWKLPLLIGVAAVGAMAAWRCFRKT